MPILELCLEVQSPLAATFEAVHDLTVHVSAIADPHEATDWLARRVASAVEADAAALYVWDAAASQLRLRSSQGDCLTVLSRSLVSGEGLIGQTFEQLEPMVVEHAIAVPLRSADTSIGVLVVYYAQRPANVPTHWLQALRLLAAQLSMSVQAAAAQALAQTARETVAFRTDASRALANALDVETTMERVAQLAVPRLADWCTIDLLAPDGTVHLLAMVHGDPEKVALEQELNRRFPPDLQRAVGVAQMLRTGKAIQYLHNADHLHDVGELDPEHQKLLDALGPRSTLIVPLRAQGKLLGALSLKRLGVDRPMAATERIELAEHLATRCSQALVNARVYHDAQLQIAEHRRTELALRESQSRTSAILEAALDSIITFDLNGRITEFNAAAEVSFELTRAAALGQPFSSVVVVEDDVPLGPARRDVRLRRGNGSGRWAAISASPLLGAQGDRVGTVAMVTDITERKEAEEALLLRDRAIAATTTAIAISDVRAPGQPVVYVNPAFERLTGYTIADIRQHPMAALTGPETTAAELAEVQQALSDGRETAVTAVSYRRDGSHFWADVTLAPVRDARGRVTHFIWLVTDVSQRKNAERQAETDARAEKLRALGQLASGVAHDLNQSLMLIASYGHLTRQGLAQDPIDREELTELCTVVTQAALDGGEIVKRLLLFGRAPVEGAASRLNLAVLAREVAQLTAPRWRDASQAEGRPISLDVLAQGNTVILGSHAALRGALTNLILNAVDALPDGGTIRICVAQQDDRVSLELADNGVGMTAEVQSHIFEPFFSTKGDKGTGLGLPAVFGIVEGLGGHVDVQSSPGNGTTFRLTFPLAAADSSPAPNADDKPAEHAEAPATQRQLRILAVDDEPALTRAVSRLLRPAGDLVTTAGSGEEAIQRLTEGPFDLVISDVGMGIGMNGWELAERVRRSWPKTRFVLASGWGASIDPLEAREKGVTAILAKPYPPEELLKQVQAAA